MRTQARNRETQQRKAIYEVLRATRSHPTAEWIRSQVRKTLPTVSLGTIYRNLSALKQEGLIRELHGPHRKARFDADVACHAHFICSGCGEIRDVDGSPGVNWRTLKDLVGCDVVEQRFEFHGVCAACLRKARAKASEPGATRR